MSNFVKIPIKPLGKIFGTQKTDYKKKISELQELEVRIRVQPDFPIIILILLTDFHKFSKPRGPNISAPRKKITLKIAGKTDCF